MKEARIIDGIAYPENIDPNKREKIRKPVKRNRPEKKTNINIVDEDFDDNKEVRDDDMKDDSDIEELQDLDANAKSNMYQREPDGTFITNDIANKEEEEITTLINVSFEFCDIREDRDYDSIKNFLSSYIEVQSDSNKYTQFTEDFASYITKQVQVGTILRVEEAGDEPLGFVTILDIYNLQKTTKFFEYIRNFILENAGGNYKVCTTLKSILSLDIKPYTYGLLIQNRVKNLPYEVAPILYKEVLKDLEWNVQQQRTNTNNNNDIKMFDKYLMIIPCCIVQSMTNTMPSQHIGRKRNSQNKQSKHDNILYIHFENEFFAKEAEILHHFHSNQTVFWPDYGKLPLQYMIVVISHEGLLCALQKLCSICTTDDFSHEVLC